MKTLLVMISAFVFGIAASAPADEIRITYGYPNRNYAAPRHQAQHYHARSPYTEPCDRPNPYVQNIVYPTASYPVYYNPAPVLVTPEPSYAPNSGSYGGDLAALHERLSRLRAILARQQENGTLGQSDIDHFTDILEGIEHDEQRWKFAHGDLTNQDFETLARRLNDVGIEIEKALAA